jgi:dihydroorotase-like cyclic amidohydrolase
LGELIEHLKPNFFIPGAAKSGTTTLHDMLNTHPEISMSSVKEPWLLEK